MSSSKWAEKARHLDEYRWRMLRERHGLLGSCFRFARDALRDLQFGLRARFRFARNIAPERCDFLLLQSAPKVIAFRRKRMLMDQLRGRDYALTETALQEPDQILSQRQLLPPPEAVPLRYLGYAAHAQWLIQHHQPKILLNDRNGSLYTPFLRLALNAGGRLLVHLAHATTVEDSRRLGMNDYDYYFMFGTSSLEALQARALRFGASVAVMAGSHMVDDTYNLQLADAAARVLLILGVGPDKEKEPGYVRSYELLRRWAELNPDYRVLFKAHPRSKAQFWQGAASGLDNVEVLAPACTLAQALEQASIVVNIMSNAVIEAALARRPVIYVNCAEYPDIFDQERFFGPCVRDVGQLGQRIDTIQADYLQYVQVAERFAEHHLAAGSGGLQRTLELLEQLILAGRCEGTRLPPACGKPN